MAGSSPDPENVHFKGIIDAVSALQSRLWMEDDPKADAPFYVWLDYISIPQANKTLQSLSISSLALYASMPDYFVVVAPPATHVDKQCACDKQTYLRRGWYACVCIARVVWNICIHRSGGELIYNDSGATPIPRPFGRFAGAASSSGRASRLVGWTICKCRVLLTLITPPLTLITYPKTLTLPFNSL